MKWKFFNKNTDLKSKFKKFVFVIVEIVRKIISVITTLFKNVRITNIKIGNFNVKISKDGKNTIIFLIVACFISFLIFGLGCITTTALFLLLMTFFFFRDPERILPNRKDIVVSPCDGLILNISTSSLPEELSNKDTREYTKISIFMNILDVHVQRMPVDCKIKQIKYIKGAFINASLDKASKDNERNIVLVEKENGDNICIVQIAGLIARRIVCNATIDETFKIGERYGMIKFGSRIELYVPKHYKIEVLEGQRLVCGETVVASFN